MNPLKHSEYMNLPKHTVMVIIESRDGSIKYNHAIRVLAKINNSIDYSCMLIDQIPKDENMYGVVAIQGIISDFMALYYESVNFSGPIYEWD